MVAVIKTGSSLHRIVNYNEQKVKAGVADCILAVNYPKDVADLTRANKLNRLLNLAALNENVTRNSVHISLNFDPSENLSPERLGDIAEMYMQQIGFGQQPYLVYQHHDAGHPHIHLVSVKVRADGSRIDMHNIGRRESETARKAIEQFFELVKAEDSQQRKASALKPIAVAKVQYGRSETKRAITNVLDAVLPHYKYTSLPELNAVLQQYRVMADRGSESSRVYQQQGLFYRVLDEHGQKVGVPIKASAFHFKPTLKYLEDRFKQNDLSRQPSKARVKTTIDTVLRKQPNLTLSGVMQALEKEGIFTVKRENSEGVVYGLTYVDHQTKSVFNGSALCKPYSAKGILERCNGTGRLDTDQTNILNSLKVLATEQQASSFGQVGPVANTGQGSGNGLELLLQPEPGADYVPHALKKKNKKKKRRRTSDNL